MSLNLQAVKDPATQQNFTSVGRQFPIQQENLADEAVGPDELTTAAKELFPQLAAAGSVKLAFGSTEITGNGTSSASKEVEHGLGKKPTVVIACMDSSSADRHAATGGYGATKFSLAVVHTTLAVWSSTATVYWLAIG